MWRVRPRSRLRRSGRFRSNADANMRRWAPEVRETLLQAAFVRRFGWRDYAGDDRVSLTWGGKTFVTLHRPHDATLAAQVKWVRHYAEQRADRSDEILSQTGMFGEYFAVLLGLTPARNAQDLRVPRHRAGAGGRCDDDAQAHLRRPPPGRDRRAHRAAAAGAGAWRVSKRPCHAGLRHGDGAGGSGRRQRPTISPTLRRGSTLLYASGAPDRR